MVLVFLPLCSVGDIRSYLLGNRGIPTGKDVAIAGRGTVELRGSVFERYVVSLIREDFFAVHTIGISHRVDVFLPVGVKVRPAVDGLAGHIFRLAFAAPEGERVALAGRGGSVRGGKERAKARGGGAQQAVGLAVVFLIGRKVLRAPEVNDILIVIDHAPEVRPAVHGDLFQTSRGIGGVCLVIIPPAVVIPAVEVIVSGIVRGVVVVNVDRGQVNVRALRLISEIKSLVELRRVAVAVDHKLDGEQRLRFLNILRIAAVVADARTRAVKLAVLSGNPIAVSHFKRIVLLTGRVFVRKHLTL